MQQVLLVATFFCHNQF